MRIKALKTIIHHGDVTAIGSVTEMDADAVKAFGPEYVEVLEGVGEEAPKPDEKPAAETTETQGEEAPKPDEKPAAEEAAAKKASKKK